MLGCRLSVQSPPLGLWKKTNPPSPVVLMDSTHWPSAAKPALGDAAKGAGLLLPPPAKGASSVDGSPAPAAFAVDEIPTSKHARIDLRSMATRVSRPRASIKLRAYASSEARLRRAELIAGGREPFEGSGLIASSEARLRRAELIAGGREPFEGSGLIAWSSCGSACSSARRAARTPSRSRRSRG